MKRQLILTIMLAFTCIILHAEESQIPLKLKVGQEIVFSVTDKAFNDTTHNRFNNEFEKFYHKQPTDADYNKHVQKTRYQSDQSEYKEISVSVLEKKGDDRFILEAKIKRHIIRKNRSFSYDYFYDNLFPPTYYDYSQFRGKGLRLMVFDQLKVKLGLNLSTKELIILRVEELREQIDSLIKEKQGKDQKKSISVEAIQYEEVKELKEQIEAYLLDMQIPNIQKNKVSLIEKCNIIETKDTNTNVINLHLSKIQPLGEVMNTSTIREIAINKHSGLIEDEFTEYKTEASDTTKFDFSINRRTKRIHLITQDNSNTVKHVSINGKFRNKPVNGKIYIGFLNHPFGTELTRLTIRPDSDNRFYTTIPMSHRGIILLYTIANDNSISNYHFIYAKPGDNIEFNEIETNNNFPELQFNGSSDIANNVLNKIQRKYPNLQGIHPKGTHKIEVNGLAYFRPSYGDIKTILLLLNNIESEFNQIISLTNHYDLSFIHSELKMLQYNNLIKLANSINTPLKSEQQHEFTSRLKKQNDLINSIDPMKSYNEYGYFSRLALHNYLLWKYDATCIYSEESWITFNRAYDFPDKTFNFARLILAGSALNREQALIIEEQLRFPIFRHFRTEYTNLSTIKPLVEKLNQTSKDTLLTNKLNELFERKKKINDGELFDGPVFLNKEGDTISIANFLNGKPLVIHATQNWSAQRYKFESIAAKHTDATFLNISEGTNYTEWLNYIKRADSKVNEIFLSSDTATINDLFLSSHQGIFIVLDKNGKIVKYGANIDKLKYNIDEAKQNKALKTNLDKSTLNIIIIVLSSMLLLIGGSFQFWRIRARRKLRRESMDRRMRELELTAIRSQMNPHFLYNSLNSVQNLVQQQRADEAHLYLSHFASLIRKTLRNSEKEEITLTEELESLQEYINLEQLRTTFSYRVSIDNQVDAFNTMVPPMLLQPFVENAIFHGLSPKADNRQLLLEIKKIDDYIHFIIQDNGVGRSKKANNTTGNGKGINLNKERLAYLQDKYGDTYQLSISDLYEGDTPAGTKVEIIIPDEE
ncbi:hypothetical protein EYV94_04605 [Puteibacter caeruleilacunae]|nr:hypothetical protein EYV94_04605 [Puteibacter caeruleilacunae]